MNTTEKLLAEYNQIRGLTYGDIGYTYFADVVGDGRRIRRVYVIRNQNGGIAVSSLHNYSPIRRCNKIRTAIAAASRQ
jgi:hypothetical protein